jgi:hypothetical protein
MVAPGLTIIALAISAKRSGLLMPIAATESVTSCAQMKN